MHVRVRVSGAVSVFVCACILIGSCPRFDNAFESDDQDDHDHGDKNVAGGDVFGYV